VTFTPELERTATAFTNSSNPLHSFNGESQSREMNSGETALEQWDIAKGISEGEI